MCHLTKAAWHRTHFTQFQGMRKSISVLHFHLRKCIFCASGHALSSWLFKCIWIHCIPYTWKMTALPRICAYQYLWHHLKYNSVHYSHTFHISVTIKMIRTLFMLTLWMRKVICFNFILGLNRLNFTINTLAILIPNCAR